MSFAVLFLKEAQADLEAIHSYLLKHSVDGANRWLDALESAIEALEEHPDRYAGAPEDQLVSAPIQNMSFKTRKGRPYRLVYTIVEQKVRVLRLLGPGHDLLRAGDLV